MLRPRARLDAQVEGPRARAAADAGEDGGVDVGEVDEEGLLGDEEELLVEDEEVALDGLQVGFDAGVVGGGLEAADADDLLAGQALEDGRYDLVCGLLVALLECAVVFCELLTGWRLAGGAEGWKRHALGHVELGGDLLFVRELHDEVAVARLSLTNGGV